MKIFWQRRAEIAAAFTKINAATIQTPTIPPKTQTVAKAVEPRSVSQNAGQAQPAYKFKQQNSYGYKNNRVAVNTEPRIDVSDAAIWPQAQLLAKYFPGTFTQIREQV